MDNVESPSEPSDYVVILGPGESGQKLKIALSWSPEQTLTGPKKRAKTVKIAHEVVRVAHEAV